MSAEPYTIEVVLTGACDLLLPAGSRFIGDHHEYWVRELDRRVVLLRRHCGGAAVVTREEQDMATLETYNPVGNGAEPAIDLNRPYTVEATLTGTAALLLHRWSNEAVREKAAAGKNTAAKKTDNIESYVYRDEAGHICLPGLYLQRALQEAGRFRQDPRSPRKSALDLCKAGIMVTPELSPILVNDQPTSDWDYLDQRRVVVQRSGIERSRPAFRLGWSVVVQITSILPEYIGEQFLRGLIDDAGRLIGVGDFRPTYGRFTVIYWSRLPE